MGAVAPRPKSWADLASRGGLFYRMGGEQWCDTPLYSWKLNTASGLFECQDFVPSCDPDKPPSFEGLVHGPIFVDMRGWDGLSIPDAVVTDQRRPT